MAWRANFALTPTMVRQAVEQAEKYSSFDPSQSELREVLLDIASDRQGQISRKSLGRWIARHAGQIVDGLRFIRASGNRSAEAWKVEVMKNEK